MLKPSWPCLIRCQDVQHQVVSSSAPSHQLPTSLLHSIFPAAYMLQPGWPCFSKCQDVQHQVASSSDPSHQPPTSLPHSNTHFHRTPKQIWTSEHHHLF